MMRRLLAVIGILAMLLGLLPGSVFSASPASAQVVVPVPGSELTRNVAVMNDGPTIPGPNVYLPIVVASGQPGPPPPPASPYATALSQALADCAGTKLNQICYVAGSVTLDGGGPLTTPGQVASLDGVSGLRLASPDASHWSVAVLRLAADSLTPDLGLTLLVFGNVEIRSLILFDVAAGNGDVAPALSFSSSPVPGEDPMTGGIIVYNPNHEDPLSIRLNGADLTLASSTVVQAQPGIMMIMMMAIGGALVQTAAGDGALIQGHQLSVPLDSNGKATGTPTTPTLINDNQMKAIAPSDAGNRLASVVPVQEPHDYKYITVQIALTKYMFSDAYDRCLRGDSHQVYRIMYYARILQQLASIYPGILTDSIMGDYDKKLRQCATFEIEFNSVITVTSTLVANGNMYVQGQGMIVSYGMDGSLVQGTEMPLTHLRYDVDFGLEPCIRLEITDGRLIHSDGYMRINRNRLDISTLVVPVDIWEHMYYTCGDPMELANPASWWTMFLELHRSELTVTGYLFTPAHWKYTGNQILAEAIFNRQATLYYGKVTGDTWLVMLHKPG
jgi:hypothetical protein